jgi:hypothetical protein
MEAKHTPGPWKAQFVGNMVERWMPAGHYVSRARPDWPAPNAREWMHDRGRLARFTSREAADAAIAKATGSAS